MKEYKHKDRTSEGFAVVAVVVGSTGNMELFLSTAVVALTFSRLVLYWKS